MALLNLQDYGKIYQYEMLSYIEFHFKYQTVNYCNTAMYNTN